jgi:hypothetical protein
MLTDASLLELMSSIGEQGYFPGEPVLGYINDDQEYIVVEGNRRLAAAKLLQHPDLAVRRKSQVQVISQESKNSPTQLPILIYPTREHMLPYLGFRHVTGVKAWDPLPKARYLNELLKLEPRRGNQMDTFRALAKRIGSRADYVARLLTGYEVYRLIEENEYFKIKDLDEDSISFSILTTALSYNNIVSFLGLKDATSPSLKGLRLKNLKDLTDWLFP